MKIEEILQGNDTLIYMERYVNEHTKSYSAFAQISEVEPQYQPTSDLNSFELISVQAPRALVSIFQANPQEKLHDFYIQEEHVLFLIHPEIWKSSPIDHLDELHKLQKRESIQVAPTSSTRTVMTKEYSEKYPSHFIKLHYPRRISRFNRRLRRKNIHNSVAVTKDLATFNFEKFAYLPDSLGFTFADGGNPWGFLIRELNPKPYRENRFLIPFFALYGGDLNAAQDNPLIVQMIERLNVEPEKFVLNEIMIQVLECWCKVARERGLLLESHAQNILLEVDQDFRPQRIVHRDFDIWIDREARQAAGLDIEGFETYIDSESPYPRTAHYSLIYDHFIGRELFSYLVKVLQDFYGVNPTEIRRQIAQAFHSSFPDAHRFFPENTTFYFSNELLPGNDFTLVDTQQPPQWR